MIEFDITDGAKHESVILSEWASIAASCQGGFHFHPFLPRDTRELTEARDTQRFLSSVAENNML